MKILELRNEYSIIYIPMNRIILIKCSDGEEYSEEYINYKRFEIFTSEKELEDRDPYIAYMYKEEFVLWRQFLQGIGNLFTFQRIKEDKEAK